MKATKFFAMLLMMTAAFSFSACGNDDDDAGDNSDQNIGSSIVGKWQLSDGDEIVVITFEASGEGTYAYSDKSTNYTKNFSYNFNGDTSTLRTRGSDGDLRDIYNDVMVTPKKLRLGGTEYERISGGNGAKSIIGVITGTWKTPTTSTSDESYSITFKNGGEGTISYKDKTTSVTQEFSYKFDAKEAFMEIAGTDYLRSSYSNIVVTSKKLYLGSLELEK